MLRLVDAGHSSAKGKVIRISHVGSLNELELLSGVAAVVKTRTKCGVDPRVGAALAVARESLPDRT
jgi:aspartate aminotransferase-like enzyme